MKVVVGVSGGVDSAVAAHLLKEKGYDVFGVIMKIWRGAPIPAAMKDACYGPHEIHDIESARRICAHLGIGFHILDCSESYEKAVLQDFSREYLGGRTPNPCVRCNQLIKFGQLPMLLKESGLHFDYFATGHYARVSFSDERGRFLLKKGADPRKDQSYFLYRLSQTQLSQALFPLGELVKGRVREIARTAGLPVHDKKESQDFYGGDPGDIIGREAGPGEIVNKHGRVLGRHRGIWKYTIGQRKGLGIPYTEPLYVVSIDPDKNRIIVGTEDETYRGSCVTRDLNWVAIDGLSSPLRVETKIRSTSKPAGATIFPLDRERVHVAFDEPISAVTPGQSAVFYQADDVAGGGIIEPFDQDGACSQCAGHGKDLSPVRA